MKQLEIIYTSQEAGREIDLILDGKTYSVTLDKGKEIKETAFQVPLGEIPTYVAPAVECSTQQRNWMQTYSMRLFQVNHGSKTDKDSDKVSCPILSSYYVMREIDSPRSQHILAEIGAGNGMEVYLNGKLIAKHLNPYRTKFRTEKVILPLKKGKNQVILRSYNRFEDETAYLLRPAEEQKAYRQDFIIPDAVNGKEHSLTIKPHNPSSPTQMLNYSTCVSG